jgi:FemAB-related protein (PEP-CTERM system-associated)
VVNAPSGPAYRAWFSGGAASGRGAGRALPGTRDDRQRGLRTRSTAVPSGADVDGAYRNTRVTTDVSETEWDGYVSRQPGSSADHLWRWREIFSGVFGHESVYLAARRGPNLVGILPLVLFRSRIFGRSVISLPFLNYGGIVADDADAVDALVERAEGVAREFRASHLELRHVSRQVPGLPSRQHKLGFTVSMPADSATLWAGLDRKVRNQVRKAQKEGLAASVGGIELVPEFYDVFARNMRDLGTPVYPRTLFEATLQLFPDRARVFVVRHRDRTVAASVAIRFRDTVLVPWASSLREFRHLCPNMLLYWSMFEQAVLDGVAVFDFGRSSPGSGPHAFKAQWGAVATPLHWEYVLISRKAPPDQGTSNPRFDAAVRLWARLPLRLANAVGPLIVRSIP